MPTAQTRVTTDRASRYLVQLCEHLNQLKDRRQQHGGNDTEHGPGAQRVEWTDVHAMIEFAFGCCELRADDDGLVILLTADDLKALNRMQEMFTSRIEMIGA